MYSWQTMPAYPYIQEYRSALEELIQFGGSDSELNIRAAFQNCLAAYCRDHRERLALIPELRAANNVIPDGTVKDTLRMARGYWEAKDSHDDLDAEIERKLNRGYPSDNIIFEDSQTAVLIQNHEETMRVDMSRPGELHRLISRFLNYELPQIEGFREAQRQFKEDLPIVIADLRQAVEEAEAENAEYQAAASDFLELCRQSISPEVSGADVREMLLQHILTKDIFLRVFAEDQFHRENNIARRLDALEGTFFTGDTRREAIDRLRAYYGAIGRAADEIADYAEKQNFLKAIYEDFYKAYNPDAADRLGVVYTPNEVVDFIIRGADDLLKKHFGRGLSDNNVQILDPATGTGTFVTNLINYLNYLSEDRLKYKYLNEIYANEVAILPYYIANLNIEYTYHEKMGRYLQFPNLCFVDTLDNMDWQQVGATSGVVTRQGGFDLGGLSNENRMRVQTQNEKRISVIIGNPPYNAHQMNFNDFNPNRDYPEIDQRIRETYVRESSAQKTKQYDMYKRFIRWASDRLDDDGLIGFVSNSAFLDARQDDGFRQVVSEEFNELWVIDLKGNARTSGERRRREAGNIFDDKIRVGVAIYFLVRNQKSEGFKVFYNSISDYVKSPDKINYIKGKSLSNFDFQEITPDKYNNWLDQSNSDFDNLTPLADKGTKSAKSADEEQAVFGLYSPGVSTNRDPWVYDFDTDALMKKVDFFVDAYNRNPNSPDDQLDNKIKWSSNLQRHHKRGAELNSDPKMITKALFRPFVHRWYYSEKLLSDRLTRNHYAMFGRNLDQHNSVINVCFNRKTFYTLAGNRISDLHFTGDTQCLPLYQYTTDGERVSNITDWGLERINNHYRREFGDHFTEVVGADSITAEDIFAYTYAVLHDPVYRYDYRVDLLRELPRLPLYRDFDIWAEMGRELLDLHLNFESADLYPLERRDADKPATKVILEQDEERGVIHIDDQTTLSGVPESAWQYMLGSRSALKWVLDQYREETPEDPTIRERFNTYRFADHKERVIDLLKRVCTVSVKTMEIVDGIRAGGR